MQDLEKFETCDAENRDWMLWERRRSMMRECDGFAEDLIDSHNDYVSTSATTDTFHKPPRHSPNLCLTLCSLPPLWNWYMMRHTTQCYKKWQHIISTTNVLGKSLKGGQLSLGPTTSHKLALAILAFPYFLHLAPRTIFLFVADVRCTLQSVNAKSTFHWNRRSYTNWLPPSS